MEKRQEAEQRPRGRVNEEDSYDPHMHRVIDKPVSDFGSLANLIKSAAGSGLFAMPNAFASVGLILGIVGTIFMGLLITGSLQLLVRIHHLMCIRIKKPALMYDDVVIVAVTTSARRPLPPPVATCIVDTMLLLCYIGIGSVYIIFMSNNMQQCLDIGNEKFITQTYYALILFPFLFLINIVKNLADIAPISIAGNILLVLAAVIGVVYALKDGIDDTWVTIQPMVSLYPKFAGMVFFSMCSPGLILAIEHSMKRPWNYIRICGILNWGMTFLVTVHIFVGVIGYLKWGPKALGNFINNHEETDVATIMALAMQAIAIYFTYGLQCYMPIMILKYNYALPYIERGVWKGTLYLWDMIIRLFITVITCVLAIAIPRLDLVTGLIGSVCIASLSTIIPSLLYILVHYEDFGKYNWRLIFGVSLLLIAVFVTICAIQTNISLIVQFLRYDTKFPTDTLLPELHS